MNIIPTSHMVQIWKWAGNSDCTRIGAHLGIPTLSIWIPDWNKSLLCSEHTVLYRGVPALLWILKKEGPDTRQNLERHKLNTTNALKWQNLKLANNKTACFLQGIWLSIIFILLWEDYSHDLTLPTHQSRKVFTHYTILTRQDIMLSC